MISENWLPSVRQTIREFVVLPQSEQIDVVMLATFLANHIPNRSVNLWMVLVAPQGEAKTELLNLIVDHPSVWKLPDRLKPAYFISTKSGLKSALFRMNAANAKLMLMSDMASLTDGIESHVIGDIDTQFKSVHDGFMMVETGLNSQKFEWRRPANDPIGFIGAGTEEFYKWLEHSHVTGSRFMCYYYDPSRHRHWTDFSDLIEIQRRQPVKAAARDDAKRHVLAFLDAALAQIDEFQNVTIDAAADRRIAAAARFVGHILGSNAMQDSGTRRSVRVRELVRMFAFMNGRAEVNDSDVLLGIKVILSQLQPLTNRLVTHAAAPIRKHERWKAADAFRDLGVAAKQLNPALEALSDVGILKRYHTRGNVGTKYELTADAHTIIDTFDPQGALFVFGGIKG